MAATGPREGGVNVPLSPPIAPATGEPVPPLFDPLELRRCAPARVEITEESGRPLRITRRFVHVRAGRQVRIKVVPQVPEQGKRKPRAHVVATDAFRVVVPEHTIPDGTVDAVVIHILARRRGRIPLPRRSELHVTVTEQGKEAHTVVIPVAVEPSWLVLFGAGFLFVAGKLMVDQLTLQTRSGGVLQSAISIASNVSLWGELVVFAGLVAVALKLIGWGAVWSGWMADDSA